MSQTGPKLFLTSSGKISVHKHMKLHSSTVNFIFSNTEKCFIASFFGFKLFLISIGYSVLFS